jgi:hypothetical protein
MSEHPNDLLLPIAEGTPPPPHVAAHLETCDRCRSALDALAAVDLAGVWRGVAAELDAPRPGLVERLLTRLGLDPSLARLTGTTPSLSPAWIAASLLVLALGMLLATVQPETATSPALLVAPLAAAAAVAFAYGPGVDPAYDVVAVTPVSPVRALLVRLAAVLAVDAVLVSVLDLVLGRDGFAVTWLLPMTGVALVAALVASRTHPGVGAATGMAVWVFVLAAVRWTVGRPVQVLAEPQAQAVIAAVVVVLLAVLVRRTAAGGWSATRGAA